MLTGNDLIQYVKSNDQLSEKELAEGAGYVRSTKKGTTQILKKAFINALLAAKGTPISVGKAPGKTAKYVTTVHSNGVVLVGRTYVEKFGLNPGDELDIVLEDDAIRLVPAPLEEEEVETSTAKAKAA